jgi:hypothetical protein
VTACFQLGDDLNREKGMDMAAFPLVVAGAAKPLAINAVARVIARVRRAIIVFDTLNFSPSLVRIYTSP